MKCSKCGTKMMYKGKGIHECWKCDNVVTSDKAVKK